MQRINMGDEIGRAYKAMQGATPMDGPPLQQDPVAKQQLDEMMPEFLRQQTTKEQQPPSGPTAGGAVEDATVLKILGDRYLEAQQGGNAQLAEQLRKILSEAFGETAPKRKREAKEQHPTLQKLRRNLGLQRINPVTVPWGGFDWHFRPIPPAGENWVSVMTEREVSIFPALKISAALVGIDNTPLYEIFSVETKALFESDGLDDAVEIRVFEKSCDACGEIMDVNVTVCESCGSLHDPFDMPLPLRLQCTELVHNWFMTDFGPYEELPDLYLRMREKMPDRLSDKETLYPFLKLSPESSKKAATTPSGDE